MVTEKKDFTVMTDEQARFAVMIESYTWLSKFWNWNRTKCDLISLNIALDAMSHHDSMIARFFLSVWQQKNLDFDIFEAATILNPRDLKIISGWISDPFWP